MFVKAISEQEVIGDYIHIEVGDEVWGNVRSYNQEFITIEEMYDNKNYIEGKIDENGCPENIDDYFKYRNIRLKIKKGSIERLYCGCNEFATHEDRSEAFCNDCKYEDPQPHYERLDTGYHAMDYMRDWDD